MLRHATQTGLTERQQAVASERHAFLLKLEKLRSSLVNAEEATAAEFQQHGPRALAVAEIARLRKLALVQERQLDEMQRAYEEEARLFAATSEAVERQRLALHTMAAALGAGELEVEAHALDGLASGDDHDEQAADETAAQFFAGEHGAAAAAARVSDASAARRAQWKCEELSLQIRQERLAHRREVEQLHMQIHLRSLGGHGGSGDEILQPAGFLAQQPAPEGGAGSSPPVAAVGPLDAQQAEIDRLREHVLYLRQRSDMFEAKAAAAATGAGKSCSDTEEASTAAAEVPSVSAHASIGVSDAGTVGTAEAAEFEVERENSEATEVKLQRWLTVLEAVCPEAERLVPGVARELLAPHGLDTCTELAQAIRVSFWSLVSGRATLRRHLIRAVRVAAEEKRAHAAECTTIHAQHNATIKTMRASQQFEKKRAALAAADNAEEKRLLEGKLSIVESEVAALRKAESAKTQTVERAKEKAAEAYAQSLAPLKAHLRTAKSDLLALGKRERLLVSLAEKQREVLSIVDRMSNLEDYEQLLQLNEQRSALEVEVDALTQQLTAVPTTIAPGSASSRRHTSARAHHQRQPGQLPADSSDGADAADDSGGDGSRNDDDDAQDADLELGDRMLRARLEDVSQQVAAAQAELLKERQRSRAALEKLAQAEAAISAAEQLRASYRLQSPPIDGDSGSALAADRLVLSISPAGVATATDELTGSDVDDVGSSSSDCGSSSSLMSSDTDDLEHRLGWPAAVGGMTPMFADVSLQSRLVAAGWGDDGIRTSMPGSRREHTPVMPLPQALPGAPPLPPGLPPSHAQLQEAEVPATGLPPPPLPTVYDVRRKSGATARDGGRDGQGDRDRRRRHRRSESRRQDKETGKRSRHGRR